MVYKNKLTTEQKLMKTICKAINANSFVEYTYENLYIILNIPEKTTIKDVVNEMISDAKIKCVYKTNGCLFYTLRSYLNE